MKRVFLIMAIVIIFSDIVFSQDVRYDIDSFFSTPKQYGLGDTYLLNYRENLSFLRIPQ